MSPFGSTASGSPTAPRRIASAALHDSNAPSGHSSPVSRECCPPQGKGTRSNERPYAVPTAFRTLTPSRTTPGPTPSPATTTILKASEPPEGDGEHRDSAATAGEREHLFG